MGSLHSAGAVAIALAVAPQGIAAQQQDSAGDRVGVELTLEAQLVKVSFPPALDATAGRHQALLSGSRGARVRIGSLEGDRALRIGALAPGSGAPQAGDPADTAVSRDLWLARTAAGWELEAGGATIPLAHSAADSAAPIFVAALHPTGAETGRLTLRWGTHVWSTEFRFDDLPARPPEAPPDGAFAESLQRDSDTSATARLNTLAERNETALVLPGGKRIAALYGKRLDVDAVDYPNLASTPAGAVVELVRAPVLRLRSEVSLRFGQTDVPTGNLAAGFAGSYALWLKRDGGGWRFVFNNEPDSWGTQHDPAFDVAEVAAAYSRTAGAFRPLGITLAPTASDSGRLVVHWGPHEWSADFAITR